MYREDMLDNYYMVKEAAKTDVLREMVNRRAMDRIMTKNLEHISNRQMMKGMRSYSKRLRAKVDRTNKALGLPNIYSKP